MSERSRKRVLEVRVWVSHMRAYVRVRVVPKINTNIFSFSTIRGSPLEIPDLSPEPTKGSTEANVSDSSCAKHAQESAAFVARS